MRTEVTLPNVPHCLDVLSGHNERSEFDNAAHTYPMRGQAGVQVFEHQFSLLHKRCWG